MDWLTQNWAWVAVALVGFAIILLRGRSERWGSVHHGDYGAPGHGGVHGASGAASASRLRDMPAAAVDPVNGHAVNTERAVTAYFEDRVYFFESEENRRRFEADPGRFASTRTGVALSAAGEVQRPHRHHGC